MKDYKAVTIRIENDLHKKVKIALINKEISFQQYVIDLIKNFRK